MKFIVKVKPIKYSSKNIKFWYYKYQNERFELFMDTKAGYLVSRPDSGTEKWNIKHNHAELIQVDDDIV